MIKQILFAVAAGLLLTGCSSSGSGLTAEQEDLMLAIASPEETSIGKQLHNLAYDVNFQDEKGRTPLIIAVQTQDMDKLRTILDLRAAGISDYDLNAKDSKGQTALHYAVAAPRPEKSVRMLLKYGAALDEKDLNGKTPLMEAARLGKTEAVKILYDAGADKTLEDNSGRTAAIFAATAKNNAVQIVTYLDPPFEDRAPTVCAAIAAKNNNTAADLLKLFFPATGIDPACGLLIMKQAIVSGNSGIVKELTAKNVPLNDTDHTLYELLRPVRLKNWVRSSANLKLAGNGQTPLFWAAEENNAEIVRILLDAGANPNLKDRHRRHPADYTTNRAVYNLLKKAME